MQISGKSLKINYEIIMKLLRTEKNAWVFITFVTPEIEL